MDDSAHPSYFGAPAAENNKLTKSGNDNSANNAPLEILGTRDGHSNVGGLK